MPLFQDMPEFFDRPIRLTDEESENPHTVLHDFFTDYSLKELREILQANAEVCVTSDLYPYDTGERRADLLYFLHKTEILFEAAFLIAKVNHANREKE